LEFFGEIIAKVGQQSTAVKKVQEIVPIVLDFLTANAAGITPVVMIIEPFLVLFILVGLDNVFRDNCHFHRAVLVEKVVVSIP
jgi:uncharacterized membrane protein YozB (DUF420 family)